MKRWFYNGTYMPDGTPITVSAECDVQAAEFLSRGYRPVEKAVGNSRKRSTATRAKRPTTAKKLDKDRRGER